MIGAIGEMLDRIASLPEPVAYIVLDHDCAAGDAYDDFDAAGRRIIVCSPSILDDMRRIDPTRLPGTTGPLFGIPMHRPEDVA